MFSNLFSKRSKKKNKNVTFSDLPVATPIPPGIPVATNVTPVPISISPKSKPISSTENKKIVNQIPKLQAKINIFVNNTIVNNTI
jgi:hypothetical protein